MKVSFSVKDVLGIAVSLMFLALILRKIQWELFAGNIRTMDLTAFGLCLIIHTVQTFFLGMRWKLLFSQEGAGNPLNGVASYWLGNFYNNLLPGRMGDAVKVYHFSVKHNIPFRNSIAATILEKFIDAQVLGLFALLYCCFFRLNLPIANWAIGGLVILIIAANGATGLLVYKKIIVKKTLGFLAPERIRAWLYRLFLLFKNKLQYLFTSGKIHLFFAVGIAIYLAGIFTCSQLIKAAGLQNQFGNISTYMVLPVFFLVIHFIPSAPSSAGVVHYGIYKVFMTIGWAEGIEMSAALENRIIFSTLLFHLVYFIPEAVIGAFYLLKERQVLFEMKRR